MGCSISQPRVSSPKINAIEIKTASHLPPVHRRCNSNFSMKDQAIQTEPLSPLPSELKTQRIKKPRHRKTESLFIHKLNNPSMHGRNLNLRHMSVSPIKINSTSQRMLKNVKDSTVREAPPIIKLSKSHSEYQESKISSLSKTLRAKPSNVEVSVIESRIPVPNTQRGRAVSFFPSTSRIRVKSKTKLKPLKKFQTLNQQKYSKIYSRTGRHKAFSFNVKRMKNGKKGVANVAKLFNKYKEFKKQSLSNMVSSQKSKSKSPLSKRIIGLQESIIDSSEMIKKVRKVSWNRLQNMEPNKQKNMLVESIIIQKPFNRNYKDIIQEDAISQNQKSKIFQNKLKLSKSQPFNSQIIFHDNKPKLKKSDTFVDYQNKSKRITFKRSILPSDRSDSQKKYPLYQRGFITDFQPSLNDRRPIELKQRIFKSFNFLDSKKRVVSSNSSSSSSSSSGDNSLSSSVALWPNKSFKAIASNMPTN